MSFPRRTFDIPAHCEALADLRRLMDPDAPLYLVNRGPLRGQRDSATRAVELMQLRKPTGMPLWLTHLAATAMPRPIVRRPDAARMPEWPAPPWTAPHEPAWTVYRPRKPRWDSAGTLLVGETPALERFARLTFTYLLRAPVCNSIFWV